MSQIYIVYFQNSQIGGWQEYNPRDNPRYGRFVAEFTDKKEAQTQARRMNKMLSSGEKKYYRMKYHVK